MAARSAGRSGHPAAQPRRARATASRSGDDPLAEALAVAFDEPHGPLDDRPGTSVVRHEVDAPEVRQGRPEVEHPTDVGEPPAVDRLVVVADEEDSVLGRREQEGET